MVGGACDTAACSNGGMAHSNRPRSARLTLSPETLLALFALYWALIANRPVLAAVREQMQGGLFAQTGVLLLIALLHYVLVAPLLTLGWTRTLLVLLSAVAVFASHFTTQLGVVMDPAMLRNLLRTDVREASELMGPALWAHAAIWLLPPLLLLTRVRLQRRQSGWRAHRNRAGLWLLALLATLGLLVAQYQGLSSLMRNHKTLRYQVLPVAPLWSLPRSAWQDLREARAPKQPIGEDARKGASWAAAAKPRLLVWVVGETVRAADWGRFKLADGSERLSTPRTEAEPEWLRFPRMQSCGTDTETSLPCMFAPVGRRDYDESRIRGQQSLLHVLARAGVQVDWWDAQSGCKGVCEKLPEKRIECGAQCDPALFAGLPERLRAIQGGGPGTHLLVLHMLGNHGPSYYKRYGAAHEVFKPACTSDDLGRCSRDEIRNAYDNALHATDTLLSEALAQLRAVQGEVDVALLFTPDHGESLGENGLYLHGLPHLFAPKDQTEVPLLFWLGEGWRAQRGYDAACLRALPRSAQPRHDHLFHTVLNLLDVRTALYAPEWDLLKACTP